MDFSHLFAKLFCSVIIGRF